MTVELSSSVTVRVLLFASYADRLGHESIALTLPAPASVGAVLERLRTLPGGDQLPARPLCARNLVHVGPDESLEAGDEIAILPPLAGG
jgi:molybdopterin converting factor small subunit